jgi:pimeloyl-ACP methyl ester carboxylesterase
MKIVSGRSILAVLLMPLAAWAQFSAAPDGGPPTRTTFLRLSNNANAIIVERVTPIPAKARIALLVTHPERVNNFNYFIGRELPKRGYPVMMMNYYGDEQTYEEFVAPIAAAINALRALPGVEKVVLAGHSTGGPELTSYQDIAENGPKACQQPERVYKCRVKDLENLPKADGVMLLDSNAGAPERTIALNPAIDSRRPGRIDAALDMFDPKNGFDPATKGGTYSPEFLKRYFAAQGARANRLIDEAQARLAKIEKGEGAFKDDEPFVVPGASLYVNGARPDIADVRLLSKTHAPHTLLKADGTRPVQIIPLVMAPRATPEDEGKLFQTTLDATVRHYLSFQGLRVTPDYALTENNVTGVVWRSTPNSIQGNLEGIRVPTLVMSATCAPHLVLSEIGFDRSAAADKEFVGVEGANHGFMPCRPEYGDTFKRSFDFVDSWLSTPGRF